MAHSLGDGIRAVNAAWDKSEAEVAETLMWMRDRFGRGNVSSILRRAYVLDWVDVLPALSQEMTDKVIDLEGKMPQLIRDEIKVRQLKGTT